MGQILHGSATTTEAIRRAIQNSQASLRELAVRYGINPKTVAKWRRRDSVCDARMGPREPRSTILSKEEEALIVAFRKHTLLSLDDCLYTLQATIPHLTRSSLHRCLQRHGINRLPETHGDKPAKRKFKSYPIGYFHVDIAEVRTDASGIEHRLTKPNHPWTNGQVERMTAPSRRPPFSVTITARTPNSKRTSTPSSWPTTFATPLKTHQRPDPRMSTSVNSG